MKGVKEYFLSPVTFIVLLIEYMLYYQFELFLNLKYFFKLLFSYTLTQYIVNLIKIMELNNLI